MAIEDDVSSPGVDRSEESAWREWVTSLRGPAAWEWRPHVRRYGASWGRVTRKPGVVTKEPFRTPSQGTCRTSHAYGQAGSGPTNRRGEIAREPPVFWSGSHVTYQERKKEMGGSRPASGRQMRGVIRTATVGGLLLGRPNIPARRTTRVAERCVRDYRRLSDPIHAIPRPYTLSK